MMTNKEMYDLAVKHAATTLVAEMARMAKTKVPNFTTGVTRYVLENKLEMPELHFEWEKGNGRRMKRSYESDIRISPVRLETFNMKGVLQFDLQGVPSAENPEVFEKLELIPVLPDGMTMTQYLSRTDDLPKTQASSKVRAALDKQKAEIDTRQNSKVKGSKTGNSTPKKELASAK